MLFYTGRGDKGTTKLFNSPQGVRLSKGAAVFDALGTLDELNCSLGFAAALSEKSRDVLVLSGKQVMYVEIIRHLQDIVFTIQAELAGADRHTDKTDIDFAELVVDEIEKILPPIKAFVIPGGGETCAYLDVIRTIARRAERKVIQSFEKDEKIVPEMTLRFLNRLSSVLFALARFANYQEGFSEYSPHYGREE